MTADHGTRARYKAGCRCSDCGGANLAYNREWRATLRQYKPARLVSTAPVAKHLKALQRAGMGTRRMAAQAGVHVSTVSRLLGYNGAAQEQMLRDTAARLLAVRPDEGARLHGAGTARRLRALIAVGHTRLSLAERSGISISCLNKWTRGEARVTAETARRVAEVYDRLWQVYPTGPGAQQARAEARRKGWLPPMAWDDSTIDDPAAQPDPGLRTRWGHDADEVEVAELVAGRLRATRASKASRQEAFARLFNAALSIEEVADRMQVSTRTAERAKARHAAAEVSEDVA